LVIGMASLDMSDSEHLVTSVKSLIGGMSTAFYTSIAGISASLAWLFLDRSRLRAVQKAAGDFFRVVRRHFPVESADELLHRLLAVEQEESAAIHHTNELLVEQHSLIAEGNRMHEEDSAILRDQKAILQNLGSDLATAFQTALEQSLTSSLTPALKHMTSAVQDLSVKIGDRQVEALEQMVTSFQEQLAEQLGGQLTGLAEAIQGAAEWHERVHTNVESLIERVQAVAAEQLALVEVSNVAVVRFTSTVDSLSQAHERIVDATVGMEVAAEHTSTLAAALEARVHEVQAQLDHYRGANVELREAITEQLDAVVEQTSSLTTFWQDFRGDLQGIGGDLRDSVGEFKTVTEEKLGQIFAQFDSALAQVVEHLAGTLAEVREVTEELPANVERLNRSVDQALVGIRTDVPGSIRTLDETLRTRLSALGEVSDSIGRLGQAVDGIAAPDSPLVKLHRSMEMALGEGGGIERTAESVRVTSTSLIALGERVETNSRALLALLAALERSGNGGIEVGKSAEVSL
jgi:methyl-accepting chemotaxis protein